MATIQILTALAVITGCGAAMASVIMLSASRDERSLLWCCGGFIQAAAIAGCLTVIHGATEWNATTGAGVGATVIAILATVMWLSICIQPPRTKRIKKS